MASQSQSVLITGACGDIGRAIAQALAAPGVRLALCDLWEEARAVSLLRSLESFGARAIYRSVDVAKEDAMRAFVEDAASAANGLDVCIANAGIVERGALLDLPLDAWHRTLDVNLTGSFITARCAAREMVRRGGGGQIVLLSSWVQDVPRAGIGAYCTSKSGLKMLAKCLALELASHKIRVNSVAPGWIDAGLTGRNLEAHPERRAEIEKRIPLGRLASAGEVARTVRLLCSEEAAYLTGTTLLVDGGSSLGGPE